MELKQIERTDRSRTRLDAALGIYRDTILPEAQNPERQILYWIDHSRELSLPICGLTVRCHCHAAAVQRNTQLRSYSVPIEDPRTLADASLNLAVNAFSFNSLNGRPCTPWARPQVEKGPMSE
jgi:hypothetical protein